LRTIIKRHYRWWDTRSMMVIVPAAGRKDIRHPTVTINEMTKRIKAKGNATTKRSFKEDASIVASIVTGIGPTRTELIEDRVQGKKRSKSERHRILLTPKRTCLNSHSKNSQLV
jgi:hypothetical protein